MARIEHVGVVGCGPVGAVLALSLCRRGFRVTMIEANDGPVEDQRAATVHPPTVEMLVDLGLKDAAWESGLLSPIFHYRDRVTGELVAIFDVGVLEGEVPYPFVLQWEQYKLVLAALAEAEKTGLLTNRFSHRVTGIAQSDDHVDVEVCHLDGNQVLRFDYVVGCDGARSTIRKLAGIAFEGFTWPERFIKIGTTFDFLETDKGYCTRNYFSDPDEWLNLFKVKGPGEPGIWRGIFPTRVDETDEEALSDEGVQRRLQKFLPKSGDYPIAYHALYKVHQRVAATFNLGRVLLAGDSAHVNNPIGGMGMNGGIHDVVNLADKLEAMRNGTVGPEALDRYTRQRRKAQVDFVQAQSMANKKSLSEKDPVARQQHLDHLRRTASDLALHKKFLYRSSLIDSLREAKPLPDVHPGSGGWIGASLLRKEDARHLDGAACFVSDVAMPGMQDIAFARSPMAHAAIAGIRKPVGREGQVFLAADLGPFQHLTAGPDIPSFRNTVYPPLAEDRVRYAGQAIALCLAPTRAEAEDIADLVEIDFEPLPAVVDAVAAMRPGSPLVWEHWPDNAFIANTVSAGDLASVAARAPVAVRRQFKMNRQACASLEGRAVMAYRDRRVDELVVYMSTQGPHVMRGALAQCIGIPEHKLRVIAPDVGGGFGGKNRLTPEEIAVVALAWRVGHPVRWIEDRREHLLASSHAREHHYDMTLYAEADGTFLGIEADVTIDAGAYSLWPTGAFAEAAMAARNLPGPYRIQHLQARNWTVATNKAPMGPYRGVARPGACFAIERMVDEVARELVMDPIELRRRNIITAAEMPYATAGGMMLDTGDYVACLDAAVAMADRAGVRARQEAGEPDGRRIGLGFAFYTEQSGHGTAEWSRRAARVVPGFETSTARMMPDGTMQLLVGIMSHGQGMETTLAQIAAHELGMSPQDIAVRHGDTGICPFGFGTFASRSIVIGGGAVARSSRLLAAKLRTIGAHLLQADEASVVLRDGHAHSGAASVSFAEIGRAAHVRSELLPAGTPPLLEVTATYEPPDSRGAFSYACHAAVVAADPSTGAVELLDYAVSEDCGTMINPMIVDGQVMGGVVQGIGTALFEEIPYDAEGQPLATTFAEYLMPCASELPAIRVRHMVTPSTFTEYGIKGVGEGGAIAPPAAIANALADAFHDHGAMFNETPCTPRRVVAALDAAGFVL